MSAARVARTHGRGPQRRRPMIIAAVVSAVLCACLLLAGSPTDPSVRAASRSDAFALAAAQRHSRRLIAAAEAATSARSLVATAAGSATAVKGKAAKAKAKAKSKAGGKYRGVVSPSLRSLLNSNEYRQLVELLASLNEQGFLDTFLERAEKYWVGINIFTLAMEEQQKGGRGVLMTIKKDWARVWPEELESDRIRSFDVVSDFWKRLDASGLVDKVMKEVLPDLEKNDFREKMEGTDTQALMKMSEEERRNIVLERLGAVEVVVQYSILSQNDKEVQGIGPKMAPFIARFVSILEQKVATQTDSLGKTVDTALIVGGVVVLLAILGFSGVLNIKF